MVQRVVPCLAFLIVAGCGSAVGKSALGPETSFAGSGVTAPVRSRGASMVVSSTAVSGLGAASSSSSASSSANTAKAAPVEIPSPGPSSAPRRASAYRSTAELESLSPISVTYAETEPSANTGFLVPVAQDAGGLRGVRGASSEPKPEEERDAAPGRGPIRQAAPPAVAEKNTVPSPNSVPKPAPKPASRPAPKADPLPRPAAGSARDAFALHLASYRSAETAERGWRIYAERYGGEGGVCPPSCRAHRKPSDSGADLRHAVVP